MSITPESLKYNLVKDSNASPFSFLDNCSNSFTKSDQEVHDKNSD